MLTQARLGLIDAVRQILKLGLSLLGVSALKNDVIARGGRLKLLYWRFPIGA